MQDCTHISDVELQRVVSEQPTETPHEDIETHVAECKDCQQRLLNFAAEGPWREEFSSSIIAIEQQSAFDKTNTKEFGQRGATECNDFDLKSIERMLEDVLQPGAHPETLGQLGRYEVEKVIGFGGMGVVLRGFDRELHRPVAIKMIAPRLVSNGTAKERFLREAKAAGALLHPNVIAIHDISETNKIPWFVMPLVVGPTLQEVIEDNGPLPTGEVVRIAKQIASGLAAAHQQGLVHRDIKPANILVDNQINRIVITDFGLARREAEESVTQTGMVAGTLNYMSPEQSRGEDVDGRSDLFSLGSLLFFLASGVTPFHSNSPMGVVHKVGNEPHSNLQTLNPAVPRELARVIDRLLEKDADDRFQSASELEEWLAGYLAHLNQPVKTNLPTLPAKPRKPRTKPQVGRWTLAGISTVVVPALIFYAGTLFGTKTNSDPESASTQTLSWSVVSDKYDITTPPEFEQELSSLANQINQIETSTATQTDWPFESSSVFDSQLNQMNQQVDLLHQRLRDE